MVDVRDLKVLVACERRVIEPKLEELELPIVHVDYEGRVVK